MPRDDGITMTWFVKVDGRVYGPYTPAQMRAFVGEGRVASHSEVSETRDQGWRKAGEINQFNLWMDEMRREPSERTQPQVKTQTANFVVIAQLEADNVASFSQTLRNYGEIETIGAGVWLLRGATTAAILRNELSHVLEREENLLVVDASRDRAAWFNLGQDSDQRIRALWTRS